MVNILGIKNKWVASSHSWGLRKRIGADIDPWVGNRHLFRPLYWEATVSVLGWLCICQPVTQSPVAKKKIGSCWRSWILSKDFLTLSNQQAACLISLAGTKRINSFVSRKATLILLSRPKKEYKYKNSEKVDTTTDCLVTEQCHIVPTKNSPQKWHFVKSGCFEGWDNLHFSSIRATKFSKRFHMLVVAPEKSWQTVYTHKI